MVNLLPAIVIGGPPHAGKSVLVHSLTCALHERSIRHHVIRPPDGEGNWSQESDQATVSQVRSKGTWSDTFVERICQDLEHRCYPLLVDMGGRPQSSQLSIFNHCTHSVLLLRSDMPEYTQFWHQILQEQDLLPLAEIYSQLDGSSSVSEHLPILKGTITGLARGRDGSAQGPLFDALLERIAALFNSYSPQELERTFFEQAPSELLNLFDEMRTITPGAQEWQPGMLSSLLANLPAQRSLSVYGKAPLWIYTAIATHTDPQPLYQFDPRIGWVQPLVLRLGDVPSPDLQALVQLNPDATTLKLSIPSGHLEYFQSDPLFLPLVPSDRGLIISGIAPYWLLTSLVRLYKAANVPWIACYQVQLDRAVVVYSRLPDYTLGNLVPLPVKSP